MCVVVCFCGICIGVDGGYSEWIELFDYEIDEFVVVEVGIGWRGDVGYVVYCCGFGWWGDDLYCDY